MALRKRASERREVDTGEDAVSHGDEATVVAPRIAMAHLRVVGVQGVVRLDHDFNVDLSALYNRLFDALTRIPDIRRPYRTVGYWQYVAERTRVYFAGIEVDSFERFSWDYERGVVAWDLGETTWAIWRERNSQEGMIAREGIPSAWLAESEYRYDSRFIGDFEVYYWKTPGRVPQSSYHEVWVPIVKKGVP
ncbi:MAG: hypothetical protein ACP5HG_14590 [Anaerolineae bacterium]